MVLGTSLRGFVNPVDQKKSFVSVTTAQLRVVPTHCAEKAKKDFQKNKNFWVKKLGFYLQKCYNTSITKNIKSTAEAQLLRDIVIQAH